MENKPLKFRIRASAVNKILAGDIGLSETQESSLAELESRENGTHPKKLTLTPKMLTELVWLRHKRDNPDLPEGLKTYCKAWLKERLYKRYEEIKSKYISKGNITEEEGFTIACVHLDLGMVYKNEEFRKDDYVCGTCDLYHEPTNTVYDNKSSWSLSQFPMFEDKCPNPDYIAQVQVYAHLWNAENCCVTYTLNDCPEEILTRQFPYNGTPNERQAVALNLIYTRKYWGEMKAKYFSDADEVDFVEIPESDRVKAFHFKRDPEFIEKVRERVRLCQAYVDGLLSGARENKVK